MDKRYKQHVHDALVEVWEVGFARIEWRYIYRWFGAKRLTNRVWDELNEEWEEVDEGKGYRLGYLRVANEGSFLTLVGLDPEGTKSEDSMFQPIEGRKQ